MHIFATGLQGLRALAEIMGGFYAIAFIVANCLTVLYLRSTRPTARCTLYAVRLVLVGPFVVSGNWLAALTLDDLSDWVFWVMQFAYFSAMWISAVPLSARIIAERHKRRVAANGTEASPAGRRIHFTLRGLLFTVTAFALLLGLFASELGVRYFLFIVVVVGSLVGNLAVIVAERMDSTPRHAIIGEFIGTLAVCNPITLRLFYLLGEFNVMHYDYSRHGFLVALVAAVVGASLGIVLQRQLRPSG